MEKPIVLFEKIFLYGYAAIVLAYVALSTQQLISNHRDDKSAVRVTEFRGDLLSRSRFLAFDRNNDGTIDEVVEEGRSLVGIRSFASLPFRNKYPRGTPQFQQLRTEYFSDL